MRVVLLLFLMKAALAKPSVYVVTGTAGATVNTDFDGIYQERIGEEDYDYDYNRDYGGDYGDYGGEYGEQRTV